MLVTSFFTFFYRYFEPQGFFWDENYHVAAAEKYLNGIFFMEQHPPLGKLLIAAGEKLIDASANDAQFINTDYAKGDFADGFSIAGYRLFPTLLGWLTMPIFFLILLLLTRSPLSATLLSFLGIFDTAFIVHARGAMLDSILLFFVALTILFFLMLIEKKMKKKDIIVLSLLFGASFACAMTTKLTGAILFLLVLALLYTLRKKQVWRTFLAWSLTGFFLLFFGVWQIHFALGTTVNPALNTDGWYRASEEYKDIMHEEKQWSPLSFPVMLKESLAYPFFYNKGVPKLDLCKPDENGSPFFFWPFGARAINYRWSAGDGGVTSSFSLVANPMGWLMGLAGVILATSFLSASVFLPGRTRLKNPFLLLTFLGLYVGYMAAMSQIDRVMYLYHYFPPLFFSFILFALVTEEIERVGSWKITEDRRTLLLMGISTLVFLSFQFMSPLTYGEPLTKEQIVRRNILKIWDVRCPSCERDASIVRACSR